MGANVIRVERPGGSMFTAAHNPRLDFLNRGKRCISINLKEPDGVATVLDSGKRLMACWRATDRV